MCVRPINVNGNVVPCGKCHRCKQKLRNDWAIRLMHEIKRGYFVTLTYNDENLPKDKKLKKKHLQDYLKRVRKHYSKDGSKMKYFGVGEYGDQFGRPHYHLIINVENAELLNNQWHYGFVYLGEINQATVLYTTKYVQKVDREKVIKKNKEFREWRIMSKHLGESYVNKNKEHHRKNKLLYVVIDGRKFGIPRFYKHKMFDELWKKDGFTVDVETGEFIQHWKKIQDAVDISAIQEENRKKQHLKLIELYAEKTRQEIKKEYLYRYDKYVKMYETLKFIKKLEQ